MEIVALQVCDHFLFHHPILRHVHARENTENPQERQRNLKRPMSVHKLRKPERTCEVVIEILLFLC